jgi:hypothetical protein
MKKLNTMIYTLLTLLVVVAFTSCQKDEKIGGTAVQTLAGEFWIRLDNGTGDTFGDSYYTIFTYNTASNRADSLWVDDGFSSSTGVPFWQIKGKAHADVANLTFSGTNIVNQEYESTFTIRNAKIIPKAATAPGTKLKTDSIYFEISFSDDADPSVFHKAGGYARTRFDADDHY